MSITVQNALRTFCSFSAFPGIGMLIMGCGAIETDATLASLANHWIGGLNLSLSTFLLVLGTAKITAVLSLWGYGPMPKTIAFVGLGLAAFCGSVAHAQVEGPAHAIPPIVYLVMLTALYHGESKQSSPFNFKKD